MVIRKNNDFGIGEMERILFISIYDFCTKLVILAPKDITKKFTKHSVVLIGNKTLLH
jgi:hypothetical protein